MKRLGGLWLAPMLAVAAFIVGLSGGAGSAHPQNDYYCNGGTPPLPGCKWSDNNEDDVNWKFTNSVPSTNMRDRIKDGALVWNAVSGTAYAWDWNSGDYSNFDPWTFCSSASSGNYEKNAYHFKSNSALGETVTCATPNGGLHDVQFVLDSDSDVDWYLGTGDPGSSQFDVWSFATHEFGHGTGWDDHFLNEAMCPDGDRPSWQTMCGAGAFELVGARYARTLETHDRHVFQDAYP